MQRPIPWLWITLIGVLLIAPGLAGRLFVDVLEGITLLLVLGPLVLGGAGFLAWQWFKRRIVTCPACDPQRWGARLSGLWGGPQPGASSRLRGQARGCSR